MSSHTPQDKASDDAEKAARKQRRFIREQYNTRYQNTMLDMKNAGLNPMLAYQQGVGSPGAAASGGGFMGEGAGSIMGGIGSMLGGGAATGQAQSSKKLRGQQGLLTVAQTSAQEASGRQSDSQTRLNDATTVGAIANARQAEIAAEYLEMQRAQHVREANYHESTLGKITGTIGMATKDLGGVGAAIGGFFMGRGLRGGAGRGPGPSQWRISPQYSRTTGKNAAGRTRKQEVQYEKWMNTYKGNRPGPNYRGPNR